MALRSKVINFFGPKFVNEFDQIDRVSQVSVVEKQVYPVNMRILIKMVNASRVECAGSPDNSMNLVTFRQQQVGQVGAVLACNSSNKCLFHLTLAADASEGSRLCRVRSRVQDPGPFAHQHRKDGLRNKIVNNFFRFGVWGLEFAVRSSYFYFICYAIGTLWMTFNYQRISGRNS